MSQDHEYAVLGGLNRAQIGHTIGIIAAAVSSIVVTSFLALVDVARRLGLGEHIPPLILWPVSAGVVYAILYWLFDRHIWKIPRLARLLRVPNLAGTWSCAGQSINPDKTPGFVWDGTITIIQSWDKIRVRLRTKDSGSNSVSAALIYDEADGFRLMYNYKNDPDINKPELQSHRGFAELTFANDLKSATGEYFNGYGRYTFGTMRLKRK